MSTGLLEARGLASAYGQSQVLWDIALDLAPGSATALIGRNGVGKSTLLHCLAGTRPMTHGTLTLAGQDISALPAHGRARAGIGFVPQGRHIFPHLTVRENLATGLSARGTRPTADAGVPRYIFDLFPKLHDIADRKGGFLSGGEQQQLAIGRALAGNPTLLLLDEPTEGIQPNVVQQIEAALRHVRRELGLTILIVEQYLDFVWRFADHYAAMQNGRIIRTGSTASEAASEAASDVAHLVHI
jgi:urea transport system ATP-binding protein